ncbi:MAG: hypothetical protein M0T83_00895 [Nitrospiraceae bacterium]|nr:hypothetical protein [Nitrospiraceae bacterium]
MDENDRMVEERERQTSGKNESWFALSGLHPVKGPAGITHLFQKSRKGNSPGRGASHKGILTGREPCRLAKGFPETSSDSVSEDGFAKFFPYENAKALIRGKPTQENKGRTDDLYSRRFNK